MRVEQPPEVVLQTEPNDRRGCIDSSTPRNVLLVIDSLGVGGAESLLPVFLRYVDRCKFRVFVLALNVDAENHVVTGVRDACSGLVQWPGRRLLSAPRIRKLAAYLKQGDFDLVHTHLQYSNVQATIAARLAGVPVIATVHNLEPPRTDDVATVKWNIERMALRLSGSRVIAVADEVADVCSGHIGPPLRRMVIIPNAIDLQRFQHVSPSESFLTRASVLGSASGPLIVAVGRVGAMKGFDVLVRAFARVSHRFPNARVVIAGRDAEDGHVVRSEIARLGLGGSVHLVGQRDDIPQLLAAADLFVLSSLSEGAPVALLEAMAAGTPVVATKVGGVPSVVEDGVNGLLVKPGSDTELAHAMERLLADPELAGQYSQAGRTTVQQFGASRWARRIEAEYESMLESALRRNQRRWVRG